MHEGDGFELPAVHKLRIHAMSQPHVIARSSISAELDDWVVLLGLPITAHLDDFPDAIARNWNGPVDILMVIKDMLPAQSNNQQLAAADTGQPEYDYRYLDSRSLNRPRAIPVNLGKLHVLQVVPPEEWQKECGEIIEAIASKGCGHVVLRPHELFRGVQTADLVEALHERSIVTNSCDPWPKTSVTDFVDHYDRLRTGLHAVASLVVDTYMSYALFRGLAIFSESLSKDAREFFAARGWQDLSWRWPGFVEPLASDDEFRAALTAHRWFEARCGDSWPGVSAEELEVIRSDPESVLDDDPYFPDGYSPVFPEKLLGRVSLSGEVVMLERAALYERFSSSPLKEHDWVGFLRCAQTAPLTDEQKISVLELSWNRGYPDQYQKEGFCLTPFLSVSNQTREGYTKDFFNRDIKDSVFQALEKSVLALLGHAITGPKDTHNANGITRLGDRISRGEALSSEEVSAFYAALAEEICSVASRAVSSKAPVVAGARVDCVAEAQELLGDRIKKILSDESCNVLGWLRRFYSLRLPNDPVAPGC